MRGRLDGYFEAAAVPDLDPDTVVLPANLEIDPAIGHAKVVDRDPV
jgi:hypothetical protein